MGLAALAAATLGACSGLPWGGGLGSDPPAPVAPVPNGLVVVVGPEAVAVAALDAAGALEAAFPQGLELEGSVQVPMPQWGDGVEATLAWADGQVTPREAELVAGPSGLELGIALDAQPLYVTVQKSTGGVCAFGLTVTSLALDVVIGFSADKMGQVKAKAAGAATAHLEAPYLTHDGCWFAGDAKVEAALMAAMAQRVAEDLEPLIVPKLVTLLPQGLGLNLTMQVGARLADGALGEGEALMVVRPPELAGSGWMQLVGEQLVVPFAVDIGAARHPCAPDVPLPAASGRPIPKTEPQRAAWLVSVDVLRRGLAALWAAGGLCGDRATAGMTLAADELATAWPALSRLPAGARLHARLWPEEAPDVTAGAGVEGPELTLKSGRVAVEVYATLDDTQVRLATVRGEVEVTSALRVDPDGTVRLQPLDVRLTAAGAEPGLLGAPDEAFAAAFVPALATQLTDTLPLLVLPPAAADGEVTTARVEGGYLVLEQ